MRSPRVRISLRSMLVLVAIAGLLIAAGREADRLWKVVQYRRAKAQLYAALERIHRQAAAQSTAQTAKKDDEARILKDHRIPDTLDPDMRQVLADTLKREAKITELRERRKRPRLLEVPNLSDSFLGYAKVLSDAANRWHTDAKVNLQNAEHAGALRRKYERGAKLPWVSLPPDPPPPGPYRWPTIGPELASGAAP